VLAKIDRLNFQGRVISMQRIASQCFRILFSALLLTTAVGKLLDNRAFAAILELYQLPIPVLVLLPLGLAFGLGELILGLAMAASYELALTARVNLGLHLGYLGLAILTNLRGIRLESCGCFGVFLSRPMTWQTVFEDLALVLLALGFVWALGNPEHGDASLRAPRAA
jgi:hypothetical protein